MHLGCTWDAFGMHLGMYEKCLEGVWEVFRECLGKVREVFMEWLGKFQERFEKVSED
jgi:hypothetical protein